MLRGNIRYEQGCANEKPSYVAAREEIILRSAFLSGKVHANAEDDGEIDSDYHKIDGCERSVGYRDRRCEQHPCLLGAAVVKPAPAYGLNETPATPANWAWPYLLRTSFLSCASQAPGESL